jgi:hypothetical protein
MSQADPKQVRIGLLVVVLVAAAIFAIVKLSEDDNSNGTSGPVGLSASELVDKAGDLDHVAYWVGPEPGINQYELTTTPDGRIYIRYLVDGAKPGDPRATFLSVGTYAVPDASKALQDAEQAGGAKGITKGDGFEALQGGNGLSVYVVFDDQPDLQVEVYDPRPGNALKFVKAGRLQPLS